ncbi:MAG: nucleotidyltransferase domain-containing protein [Chloroflexi bacterium]|nr:nucleotidyltransferase domain-containing protein [Chloroflexota bacterium]
MERAATIDRLVGAIVNNLAPDKVILFGSQATGHADEESDIDILIVMNSVQDRLERTWTVYQLLKDKRTGPLDIIVLTPQEYQKMKKGGYPLIREVEEEGAVLYERSG